MLSIALLALSVTGLHLSRTFAAPSRPVARAQGSGITLEPIWNTTVSGTVDHVDLRYATNITLNGHNFRVMIDTGSIDLWVSLPSDLPVNDTGIPVDNQYAASFVNGTIAFATLEIGGYTVNDQAFNNAKSVSSAFILELGLDGLLGISLDGNSEIANTLELEGVDPSLGESFLLRVFDQTPDQNNFIGISLARTDDLEGTAESSLTINDVDPTYSAVENATEIPLFPGDNSDWSFLVDSITLDGAEIALPASVVEVAPENTVVFLLDTGTPTAAMSQALLDAIYSKIPGAELKTVSSANGKVWTVPCNTSSILSINVGAQKFPIHPLDLSSVYIDQSTNLPVCLTAFGPGAQVDRFDILAGDSFMRNFYSIFNFGPGSTHTTGKSASVLLLSQTNAQTAGQDAVKVRNALLANVTASSPGGGSSGSGTGAGSGKHSGAGRMALDSTFSTVLIGAALVVGGFVRVFV